jgi:hypothetical protein
MSTTDTQFARITRGGAFHIWRENFVTKQGEIACRPNYLRLGTWERIAHVTYRTEYPVTAHLMFNYEHPNDAICRQCLQQVGYSLNYSSPEAITEFVTLTGLDPMKCFFDISPDPTVNQLERFAKLNDIAVEDAWDQWLAARRARTS